MSWRQAVARTTMSRGTAAHHGSLYRHEKLSTHETRRRRGTNLFLHRFLPRCPPCSRVESSSTRNGRSPPADSRVSRNRRVCFEVELGSFGFDAEEEPVAARQRESRHVEDRVIRHRQAVQRQHAEHRRQRGGENRALEGDRDERRPAVIRLAADVERISDRATPSSCSE